MNHNVCPNCGSLLKPGRHICRQCGYQLPKQKQVPDAVPDSKNRQAFIPPSQQKTAASTATQKSRGFLYMSIGFLLAVVLVLVILLIFLLLNKEDPAPETQPPQTTMAPSYFYGELTSVTTATTAEAESESRALQVLQNIWNVFGEEEKFFAMGGDYNAPVDGAPGTVTHSEYITGSLLVPGAELADIAETANLVHAMNANTFTCGAYVLKNPANTDHFIAAMAAAIQNNQWLCGFPELLLIAEVDGVILVAFGHGDVMHSFRSCLTKAWPGATLREWVYIQTRN